MVWSPPWNVKQIWVGVEYPNAITRVLRGNSAGFHDIPEPAVRSEQTTTLLTTTPLTTGLSGLSLWLRAHRNDKSKYFYLCDVCPISCVINANIHQFVTLATGRNAVTVSEFRCEATRNDSWLTEMPYNLWVWTHSRLCFKPRSKESRIKLQREWIQRGISFKKKHQDSEIVHGLTLSLPSSKSTFSQPFEEKCISDVVRIGCSIIWVSYEKPSSSHGVM